MKRASDLFDQRRAEMKKELAAKGMRAEDIAAAMNDPDNYSGKYFFVPDRARWNEGWDEEVIKDGETKTVHHPALKHVKENVGSTLNKALEAIEDAVVDALQDVMYHQRIFEKAPKKFPVNHLPRIANLTFSNFEG